MLWWPFLRLCHGAIVTEKPLEKMCVEVQAHLLRFSDLEKGLSCDFPECCHLERRRDLKEVEP